MKKEKMQLLWDNATPYKEYADLNEREQDYIERLIAKNFEVRFDSTDIYCLRDGIIVSRKRSDLVME